MPLLILEGPDGSGKTTLAAKLLKGTGHPTLLIKRSGPPGDIETLQFQARWIANQAKQGLNIIADRHPLISEAIYAPVVRKVSPPPWSLQDVIGAMKDKDLLLIYCRPDYLTMQMGSTKEKQMDGVHTYFRELVAEYDDWMNLLEGYGVPFYRHDYTTDPDCFQAVDLVRSFWEKKR